MTVKVPPRGTRGIPFPRLPAWLAGFLSRRQLRGFRRRHGGRTQGGVHTLMLETVGAKSGQLRAAMVGYLDDGPGAWLVSASLGGAARNPAWIHNLAHDPDATIESGDGRREPVRARTLDGAELETAWSRFATDAPEYVKYRSRTDREIPIVSLRQR